MMLACGYPHAQRAPSPSAQISEHFEAVRATEAYRALPRPLVDDVAGRLAAQTARLLQLLARSGGAE